MVVGVRARGGGSVWRLRPERLILLSSETEPTDISFNTPFPSCPAPPTLATQGINVSFLPPLNNSAIPVCAL